MAATLLTPGEHVLRNVPSLADTRTMARVLEKLGARRVVMQGMSVHMSWTCTAAVQFITSAQACRLQASRC